MDWTAAIEENREALRRVLAMLVAMAGLGAGGTSDCPLPIADRRPTLPRRLHRAVLCLLRPAEAAARRLVIVAARGLQVALAAARPRKPRPAVTMRRSGAGVARGSPRPLALPLFDPLPRWRVRRRPAPGGVPRIAVPGLTRPFAIPPAPAPDDPIDATRLALRLGALASALDDLPRQARRFARWRAARHAALSDAAAVRKGSHRFRRVWPLRPGRPPGGRLARYDPDARRRANIRDVDEILARTNALARFVLSPDTS